MASTDYRKYYEGIWSKVVQHMISSSNLKVKTNLMARDVTESYPALSSYPMMKLYKDAKNAY